MKARKNKISQLTVKLSDQEIAAAYKNIVDWKSTGVLSDGPSKLEEIEKAIRDEIGWQGVHYREAEDAVLMEAGRRFYNLVEAKNSQYADPKAGSKVWYVDFETGEIETGKIFSVHFKDGELDSFSVDFDCGDFDEFYGSAMGEYFFVNEEDAHAALRKGG